MSTDANDSTLVRAEALLAEDGERCWADCVMYAIDQDEHDADGDTPEDVIGSARNCIAKGDKWETCWCGRACLYNGRPVVMDVDAEFEIARRSQTGEADGEDIPW
jgi:hypothetical protein